MESLTTDSDMGRTFPEKRCGQKNNATNEEVCRNDLGSGTIMILQDALGARSSDGATRHAGVGVPRDVAAGASSGVWREVCVVGVVGASRTWHDAAGAGDAVC